jgi:prepilin-type N-terminal cleavage/methylation domain-containing protein
MQNKHKGFTLIELMVTIAVMVIIAMMAAPSFGDMLQRQNLNKSTRELVATLNQARAKAALERREITVTLNSVVANTENTLNWAPQGKVVLDVRSPTTIIFMPNGLVRDQAVGTEATFSLCDDVQASAKYSKTVSISRMGTIQQIVDGDCS